MSSVNGGWDGPSIVKDGLVLYLDAGSPNSFYPLTAGTTWKDISGNSYNSTLVNGPTYSFANGGSIVFDGVDDYYTGSFVCNKTFYSVDFWIYPTTVSNYNQGIGFNNFWGDFGVHTDAAGGVYVGTSVASRISPWRNNVYVTNVWQNFTWTFNNGASAFYKNGVLETSATLAVSTSPQFTTVFSGTVNGLTGRLANFKVYSGKALTASEITQNFQATRARFGI